MITAVKYKLNDSDNIVCYDEDNNVIDSLTDYIYSEFEDKISVRKIKMEYEEDKGTLIVLNNKLER